MKEEELIAQVLAVAPHAPSPAGPGDDCAVLPDGRVITTDAMVEGVHFLRRHPARWLGWKLVMVNASDVSAMGASTDTLLFTACLPDGVDPAWWRGLCEGLAEAAEVAGATLVGGDVTGSPASIMLSITALGGPVPRPLTRSGGRPGDVLMVHGSVGRSAEGLRRWLAEAPPTDPLVRAHLRPEPPLAAGRWAVDHGATAGMDMSDGLARDAHRLAVASGCRLVVPLDALPDDGLLAGLSPDARVAGGEDYGLLVLVPEEQASIFASHGFARLGRAEDRAEHGTPGVRFTRNGAPAELSAAPFEHFAPPAPRAKIAPSETGS